jgi:tRNA threonylcarbamoyladenosine biosynthesis protein TsaE
LADPEELEYLGLRDLLGERSLLLVEWPDRGAGSLPPADLRIDIEHRDAGRRLRLDAVSARGREAVRSAVDAFSSIRCQETGLSTGNS